MKKVKRMAAVLLYLLLAALLLGLRPKELFDLRQLLLVLAGGMILYLPSMGKEDFRQWTKPDYGLLARDTIYASYIETFVLVFLLLYQGPETDRMKMLAEMHGEGQAIRLISGTLMREIAMGFRPLLYGICIWIAFGKEDEKPAEKAEAAGGEVRVLTAQESYQHFLEMGLTRREAEVAVQVCRGVSNKEIAMELSISEATVKKHMSNIFEKLGVKKREEIWKYHHFSE